MEGYRRIYFQKYRKILEYFFRKYKKKIYELFTFELINLNIGNCLDEIDSHKRP